MNASVPNSTRDLFLSDIVAGDFETFDKCVNNILSNVDRNIRNAYGDDSKVARLLTIRGQLKKAA